MDKVSVNKFSITDYGAFAREYIRRRILWERNTTSFASKIKALHSMAAALGVDINPRSLYSQCCKFRRVFQRKVRNHLMACIEKKQPPEMALKRAGVLAWVRETDAELQYLATLIESCRLTGELPHADGCQVMWAAFVDKMAEHCRAVQRTPNPGDIRGVVNALGMHKNNYELLETLWKRQQSSSLSKFACLCLTGDKPSETVALTLTEWKIIDLMALYMEGFSLVYDGTVKESEFVAVENKNVRRMDPNILEATKKVLAKEMSAVEAAKVYNIPKKYLLKRLRKQQEYSSKPKGTFKTNVQIKQLVNLCCLVKIYRVEETGPGDVQQRWAMLVRNYSRTHETSPSGIILQLRWHELKQLSRKHIISRMTDKRKKVHPLLVEIATKYPHILKDTDTWAKKVSSGEFYDVSNVPIQLDQYYLEEDESDCSYDDYISNNTTDMGKKCVKNTSIPECIQNNAKLATNIYEQKNDDVNINDYCKSDLTNDKIASVGVKDPVESNLSNIFVPTPITKVAYIDNDPKTTSRLDVAKDDLVNASKESDLELLQKIDPTQAETVIIFSDSDTEEDNSNEIKEKNKVIVFNLNDVKKYLHDHNLDDILMKMDDVGAKNEVKKSNEIVNRRSSTYICLSDSDEETTKSGTRDSNKDPNVIIIDRTDNAIDLNVNRKDTCPISTEKFVSNMSNEISLNPISNFHAPTTNMTSKLNKKVANTKTTVDSGNDIKKIYVKKKLKDPSDKNKDDHASKTPSKTATEAMEQLNVSGLSLFKLHEIATKSYLGDNMKNPTKVSELYVKVSEKVNTYLKDTNKNTDKNEQTTANNSEVIEDNSNILNKKLEIEKDKEMSEDVLSKNVVDSSDTTSLINSEDENSDEDNTETPIDPKLIMDARVYLPNLDEIESYTKNRRVNFSINTKRISNLAYKILNYKRKSDDPTRIQDNIDSEITVASKGKMPEEKVPAKRMRRVSDEKLVITSHNPESTSSIYVNLKTDDNLKNKIGNEITLNGKKLSNTINIVQRIKFEMDDHIIDRNDKINEKENVYVKTEVAHTNDSKSEHTTDGDDNSTGSDEIELNALNNKLMIDSTDVISKSQTDHVINEHNDVKLFEYINNKIKAAENLSSTKNEYTVDRKLIYENENNEKFIESFNNDIKKTYDGSIVKIEKFEVDETELKNPESCNEGLKTRTVKSEIDQKSNKNRVKLIKNRIISDDDTSSDDDVDLETLNVEKRRRLLTERDHRFPDDDEDSRPINNISEMLRVCKPVKICLERVKVPSEQSQVRKVELPDRASLKRHRAPTAHVVPINVSLSSACDMKDDEATNADIGTLLRQLSMETATEWQRLVDSVQYTCQVKNTKLCDHTYARREKAKSRREKKKLEKVPTKPKTPDPDELRLQNKEWQRQKTINNRFFNLTPKYTNVHTPVDNAKDTKNKLDNEVMKNADGDGDKIGSVDNTLDRIDEEIDSSNMETGRNETELAIKSLIDALNDDTNKNNDISYTNIIEYDAGDGDGENKESNEDENNPGRASDYLLDLHNAVKDIKYNDLKPIYTKVGMKNELVPIATKIRNSLLKHVPTRIIQGEAVKNECELSLTATKTNAHRHVTTIQKKTYGKRLFLQDRSKGQDSSREIEILPSTSRDVTSNNTEWICLSEDSCLEFETVAQKEDNNTDIIKKKNDVVLINKRLNAIKQATKRMQTTIKVSMHKDTIDQSTETIELTDSDPDDTSQAVGSDVTIDKMVNKKNVTVVKPPVTVLKKTYTKTDSKCILKMMQISPIDAGVIKKIDNLLKKENDCSNGPQINNVITVSSIIDLDDSSDEVKDDQNEAQSIKDRKVNSIPKLGNNEKLDDTTQMPQIVNVSPVRTSENIDKASKNNPNPYWKPLNSEDENFDSDTDELQIDETVICKEEENIETVLDVSQIENLPTETKNTENKTQLSIENNSENKVTDNVPTKPKKNEISTEVNDTLIVNEKTNPTDAHKDSSQKSIDSVNHKIVPQQAKNAYLIDDTTPKTDRNLATTSNNEEFNNLSDNTDTIFKNNITEEPELDKIIDAPKFNKNTTNSNENNAKTDEEASTKLNTDVTTDQKHTDKQNDKENDDKPKDDPKTRPFLKLVPIQKLLEERIRTDNKVSEPNVVEEETIGDDNLSGKTDLVYELNSKEAMLQENKLRGAPIPFMCIRKAPEEDVTEDCTNLPMISNVVSLSDSTNAKNSTQIQPVIKHSKNTGFALIGTVNTTNTEHDTQESYQFPPTSSGERLNPRDLSIKKPALVWDFVKNRDCTNLSLLCVDRSQPLWKVQNDYLITTNLKLPLAEPSYWSLGGGKVSLEVIMDASAEGSTVVGQLSIPDEVFLDNHWYRKLTKEPMIYAKILYVVPNSKTCQDMISIMSDVDMHMQLYSNVTGEFMPLSVKKSNLVVKKTVVKICPDDQTPVAEVITLDSDDE